MSKQPPNQPALIPFPNPLHELDDRVRTTEIGGEIYASILDIFQYHGGKKNPRTAWATTLGNLKKQGSEVSTEIVQWRNEAANGGKHTPMINLQGFLRIVQATEIKEWESIRQWLAKTGADTIKAQASKEREKNIELHRQSGLGDTIEARRYEARHVNIEVYKQLQSVIARVGISPQVGRLTNAEYIAVLGETTDSLKLILRTKSIRDALNVTQIRTLTYAEETLRDILATQSSLTNEQMEGIIYSVLTPIGDMLKSIMNAQGLDHITGKPLLGE